MLRISPNKVPGSFIESRHSMADSDMSSAKRDSVNIFCGSDNKFPDVNRSFQYGQNSENSSVQKLSDNRNVSQKYLQHPHMSFNEKNVLRERLTDPNNISNNASNSSITISHHTMNQSNYESDRIVIANLKHDEANKIQHRSAIDLERVIKQSLSTSTIRQSRKSDENQEPNNSLQNQQKDMGDTMMVRSLQPGVSYIKC